MKDEHWSQLHNQSTANFTLRTPELWDFISLKKLYDEALKLLGYKRKSPVRNFTFRSRRTKNCIELVVEENTLQTQISATIDPQEKASLQRLQRENSIIPQVRETL